MESYQYLLDYFENAPTIIKGVWILSILFFITVVILTIYLKYLRNHLRKNEKTVALWPKNGWKKNWKKTEKNNQNANGHNSITPHSHKK